MTTTQRAGTPAGTARGVMPVIVVALAAVVSAISVDGRSISETAGKLGMSEVAVRVALHRGLQAIAKRFKST